MSRTTPTARDASSGAGRPGPGTSAWNAPTNAARTCWCARRARPSATRSTTSRQSYIDARWSRPSHRLSRARPVAASSSTTLREARWRGNWARISSTKDCVTLGWPRSRSTSVQAATPHLRCASARCKCQPGGLTVAVAMLLPDDGLGALLGHLQAPGHITRLLLPAGGQPGQLLGIQAFQPLAL